MSRAASAVPDRRGARAASCRSDMPQDARPPRPRRRGEIPCLPHDRLMAEERERHGFLGLAVEEDLIEEHDRTGLDLRGNRSTSAGFFAPPPEMTTSALSSFPHRAMARPIDSAVSAVAVATASLSEPPALRTRASSLSAYSIPNRSRPVLLGGG